MAHLARVGLARHAGWAPPGADVTHVANLTARAPRRGRVTATLHDLTCWLRPEWHTAGNIAADRRFAEQVLVRADAVIAVSEQTRRDALRVLSLRPERVHTIHSGVGEAYFQAGGEVAGEGRYVLYTGTVEPRKNLERLLDAWLLLPRDYRREFELRVAGPAGWGAEATEARMRATEGVKRLGYVPEEELPGLMRGAAVFVYPSLYEGFGLPVVQAMAAGAPVLASTGGALAEVAGGAAELVNPLSTVDLAAGLRRLLDDGERRARLSAAGRARAEAFRWRRCAEQSWRLFERVGG